MRNNGRGGMQTGGLHYSLYCPKCGKPAARVERTPDGDRYMHFTKKGAVWHKPPPDTITANEKNERGLP